MKKRFCMKVLAVALLSVGMAAGCAATQKETAAGAGSGASMETKTALNNARDAIGMAKTNNWIWRDTEEIMAEAEAAAASGDDATAIKMADKARQQAELAIEQYRTETANPRYKLFF
jgi:hypothetical protein